MNNSVNLTQPLRRVRSLPGSMDEPFITYEYPTIIDEALNAPRQSFTTFDKGMRMTPAFHVKENHDGIHADAAASSPAAAAAAEEGEEEGRARCAAAIVPCAAAPTEGSMTDENNSSVGSAQERLNDGGDSDRESIQQDSFDPEDAEREVRLDDEPEVCTTSAPKDEAPLPRLTATEECVAYDAARMKEWLIEFRDCRDHCPRGIAQFLQALPCNSGKAKGKAWTPGLAGRKGTAPAAPLGFPAFGAKLGHGAPHDIGSDAGSSSGPSQPHISGRQALAALGDIWEDRKDIPIAVGTSVRKRGLFGGVEKKELHQMVLSVLNKVTSDPVKFREVKNELLRLPIPEASAEQLDDVVDVFFTKAVHEPHFCSSYAALIAALCKVPRGQHITGDKTLSLEYRLRKSLVRRCQREFLAASQDETGGDAETTKERREVMVGNVRFVCELFMQNVVAEAVVTVIFMTCCTGSEFGTFTMPPTHTPSEAQVDEIIAAIQATGLHYFKTQHGQKLLPFLTENLRYWTEHHHVSRCRFILMSTVDTLQGFANELASAVSVASPSSPSPQPTGASPRSQVFSPIHTVSDAMASSGLGAQSNAGSPSIPGTRSGSVNATELSGVHPPTRLSPVKAPASPTAPAVGSPKSATTVGGKALPVPRSQRMSVSAFSDGTASPTLSSSVVASPSGTVGQAPTFRPASLASHQPPVLSPASDGRTGGAPALSPTSPRNTNGAVVVASPATEAPVRAVLKQPVRPEAVAKLMADYSTGASTAEATVARVIEAYGDPLPVLEVWFDRCFAVFREEKTRLKTGEFLTAVLAKGLADVEELREQVFRALQRAVAENLHEDLKLFRFWAQCVMSDAARAVLDEEMLEEALVFLWDRNESAMRAYLSDVGAWYAKVLTEPAFVPAEESADFVRYRPLSRLHEILGLGTGADATAVRDGVVALVNFPDVRKNNLEIDMYCALCASPAPPNFEALFEKVRTSPRLPTDPTFPAAVINPVLLAEHLWPEGRALLEDALPLLLMAVDGPNRREREIAVVVEAQRLIHTFDMGATLSAEARVFMKLRTYHVVSDETIDRAQQYLVDCTGTTPGAREAALAEAATPLLPAQPASNTRQQQPQQQQPQQQPPPPTGSTAVPTHALPPSRQIEAPKPRAQQAPSAAHSPTIAGKHRSRADSLRSTTDLNSSSNSSRHGHQGAKAAATSVREGGHHKAGGRSSNGSNQRTPDAAQLAAQGDNSTRGMGRARASYSRAGGRGRYDYRPYTAAGGGDDASADTPPSSHRVTGYQGPRARGGGAQTTGKSNRHRYQNSSSYYGYNNSNRTSNENSFNGEGGRKK